MANQRSSCWSLTINNPTDADEEHINMARQKGWHVVGQKERGENGTEHYQLMLKTPQVRFSAIKKQFPRAHIEVARDPIALANYVQKEETRVGELIKNDSMYPTMSKVWHLMAIYMDSTDGRNGAYMDWDADRWLREWDSFIGDTICDGLYVEHIGANPQNRSIIKLYGRQIVARELARMRKEVPEQIVDVESYPPDATDEEEIAPPPPECPSPRTDASV